MVENHVSGKINACHSLLFILRWKTRQVGGWTRTSGRRSLKDSDLNHRKIFQVVLTSAGLMLKCEPLSFLEIGSQWEGENHPKREAEGGLKKELKTSTRLLQSVL